MSTNKKKSPKKEHKKRLENVKIFLANKQTQMLIGVFLILLAIFLFLSFSSFLSNWESDQSALSEFSNKSIQVENLQGKIGARISNFFLYDGFGISSFIYVILIITSGGFLLMQIPIKKLKKTWLWGILGSIWLSIFFGFITKTKPLLPGVVGYEINDYLSAFIGKIGVFLVLLFSAASYLIIRFKLSPEKISSSIKKGQISLNKEIKDTTKAQEDITLSETTLVNEDKEKHDEEAVIINQDTFKKNQSTEKSQNPSTKEVLDTEDSTSFALSVENLKPTIKKHSTPTNPKEISLSNISVPENAQTENEKELEIEVEKVVEEKEVSENLSNKLVEDFGEFDPTLDLGNFQFPPLDLLKVYNESISVNADELEHNKNRIVETLLNYKIGISEIKATVGPTVTLYEIIPEAGVRISKIKNLEDDIALSLAALGIRIIAPIPGKGTIGIEVPSTKPSIVSMHSVVASTKFQSSSMELPLALGKTISNETLVADLAKMPHLLMAGATGQGKSVGLNAILTSLLYKKHPAEVKFVLVDPKKVELTLFNKIERHYLAKLPDTEEAIITDTTKVVHTLNSLCIEMDNRYDLLKNAMVRNIKEYNVKFKARKLNPENGHQFLPYIIVVIDEFADLIMTAGKEVEMPIARLAQLARAIGIHLIVATQRPSVNVITGIIKANFPARIAFRVTSKIDSRTILDGPGADQLIGRGDMLYTQGNDLIRIQCAFVDTPEVEKITEFIGSQKAYPDAHILPEYVGEESGTSLDIDIKDRDKLFEEAALVIVNAQQGSTSLLQRKLKLGYNRAGRIIDQLEAAGIVGPFEGSKARQVLVPDEIALNQLLEHEKK
jgi:S-DNA-T family DNA segregation ATPase FtsK/SpoIIIE